MNPELVEKGPGKDMSEDMRNKAAQNSRGAAMGSLTKNPLMSSNPTPFFWPISNTHGASPMPGQMIPLSGSSVAQGMPSPLGITPHYAVLGERMKQPMEGLTNGLDVGGANKKLEVRKDSLEETRMKHCESERRRRGALADGFEKGKAILPEGMLKMKRPTRQNILHGLISYIYELQERLAEAERKLSHLDVSNRMGQRPTPVLNNPKESR